MYVFIKKIYYVYFFKVEDGIEEEIKDEDKYADDMAPGQSVDMDSRTRITVRNLRIREDTAKYLYNLNSESAYYDPKSRSMRENPFEVIFKNFLFNLILINI